MRQICLHLVLLRTDVHRCFLAVTDLHTAGGCGGLQQLQW